MSSNNPAAFPEVTLRDYFAAQALISMDTKDMSPSQIAQEAYWIADEMIEVRAK